jgi:hypothetical protein
VARPFEAGVGWDFRGPTRLQKRVVQPIYQSLGLHCHAILACITDGRDWGGLWWLPASITLAGDTVAIAVQPIAIAGLTAANRGHSSSSGGSAVGIVFPLLYARDFVRPV